MHISSENSSFMYINYEKSEMFGLAWAQSPLALLPHLRSPSFHSFLRPYVCTLSFAVWRLLVVRTYIFSIPHHLLCVQYKCIFGWYCVYHGSLFSGNEKFLEVFCGEKVVATMPTKAISLYNKMLCVFARDVSNF